MFGDEKQCGQYRNVRDLTRPKIESKQTNKKPNKQTKNMDPPERAQTVFKSPNTTSFSFQPP